MNCKAYFSFEGVSSNHRIILVKIHLYKNKKQTHKPVQHDWSSFTKSDIYNDNLVIERNKFETFQETSERLTFNDYENFVAACLEAVVDYLSINPRVKCTGSQKQLEKRR